VSDESFDDQQDSPNWRRELEEKARRADDLEAQLAEVKRQQAFNEAGITSANPAYKYFTKGYDGEMTVDAIKVAATEAGVLQTNQQASTQQDSPMLSQYDRIANASKAPPRRRPPTWSKASTRRRPSKNHGPHELPQRPAHRTGLPHHLEPAVTPTIGWAGLTRTMREGESYGR